MVVGLWVLDLGVGGGWDLVVKARIGMSWFGHSPSQKVSWFEVEVGQTQSG